MNPCSVWNIKGAPIPEGYIPAVEAAGILSISQNAFYNRVLAGVLPKPLEGQFFRVVGGSEGVPTTVVPVKKVWSREEIAAAAAAIAEAVEASTIPAGFIRAEVAADLLGMSTKAFGGKVSRGLLPAGIPHYIKGIGHRPVNLWRKEDLLPYRSIPARKPGKPEPADLALLARLRAYADADGFVSGDSTDLVLGNPVREYDRRSISRLRTANLIRTSIDNLGRLICTVAPESSERPGSREWRSF